MESNVPRDAVPRTDVSRPQPVNDNREALENLFRVTGAGYTRRRFGSCEVPRTLKMQCKRVYFPPFVSSTLSKAAPDFPPGSHASSSTLLQCSCGEDGLRL